MPTDEAFNAWIAENEINVLTLGQNPEIVGNLLQYHVVPGGVIPSSFIVENSPTSFETLATYTLPTSFDGESAYAADAEILRSDLLYASLSNSAIVCTIHMINKVLEIPDVLTMVAYSSEFTLIASAVSALGLELPEGTYTILAPTDASLGDLDISAAIEDPAFADFLGYHVLVGEYVQGDLVGGSTVRRLLTAIVNCLSACSCSG